MPSDNLTRRRAVVRLANVIASDVDDALRDSARAVYQLLRFARDVPPHLFDPAQNALAEAISAMPYAFAVQLDFLGILCGKTPKLSQHRLRNVSAALRGKGARLGRLPTEADFPAGHPVPLFALGYWGGVAAWSAGSADRAQHPKGYWADRDNQASTDWPWLCAPCDWTSLRSKRASIELCATGRMAGGPPNE